MTIEGAIAERLRDIAELTALVGNRIYQMKPQQNPVYPFVRMQLVGDNYVSPHLRGPGALKRARIQIDSFVQEVGSWYASAGDIADLVEGDGLGPNASGLNGWIGTLGGSPPEFEVTLVQALPRRPSYEAGELRIARMQVDYMVTYKRLGVM